MIKVQAEGTSTYADDLLNDWEDDFGNIHRGLIDANHDIYVGFAKMYPNAVDKLRLLSPRKYRTQMVEEFIELIELGVIRFPFEYNGGDFIQIIKKESENEECIEQYELNDDEKLALIQIDLMKSEITSIHRNTNPEKTSVSYALSKEKEGKLYDDRFYTVIMLAHRLYELRRGSIIEKPKSIQTPSIIEFRKPVLLRPR